MTRDLDEIRGLCHFLALEPYLKVFVFVCMGGGGRVSSNSDRHTNIFLPPSHTQAPTWEALMERPLMTPPPPHTLRHPPGRL